jgi:hypothetical protein
LTKEDGEMKEIGNETNGKKKKEPIMSWVGSIFGTPDLGRGPKPASGRGILKVAPVTREEADLIVDFFHNKEGDILLFLNDTADPKLMTAMRFYFEHKQNTEGLGWMIEIVPERAYLIMPERPKLMELHASEEGVTIREAGVADDGTLESHTPGTHPGAH